MYLTCNAYGQINFVSGKQFGTDKDDVSQTVLADSLNNVFSFGSTTGLLGENQYGGKDGVICKYDSTGKILWVKQFGSQYDDEFNQACFDKNYNIYVTGYCSKGKQNKDVWILKLNLEGNILWERTFGTNSDDIGRSIVVDNDGEIYIIGYTNGNFGGRSKGELDCFILSLNEQGEKQSIVQFGSQKNDKGYGITIGPDSLIYVCGTTMGDLAQKNYGKLDAYWGVFSKKLDQHKLVQFGTSGYDIMYFIHVDSKNNIVIAGNIGGQLATEYFGHQDAYFRKMDNTGKLLWHEQFGTVKGDYINGLVINTDDEIVISGCQNYSDCQAFCRMYSEDGKLLWKTEYAAMGIEHGTCGKGICINKNGYIYHTGVTGGNLFSDLKGEQDMFVIKLELDSIE